MDNMIDMIRFRMLANELTDTEFIRFLSRWIRINGRDELLKLIFDKIMKTKAIHKLTPLTSIISQIITTRTESSDNDTPSSTISSENEQQAPSSPTASIASSTISSENEQQAPSS